METKIVLLNKDYTNDVNGILTVKDHTFSEAVKLLKAVEEEEPDDLTQAFITQIAIEGWTFTYTNDVCSISI